MLQELARVFLCLAAGEVLARTGVLPWPGAVIGLVVLLANLLALKQLPAELGKLADAVHGVLGMLFVPAGVGVLAYADLIRAELVPVAAAVFGGTIVTIGVTGLTASYFARRLYDGAPAETANVSR